MLFDSPRLQGLSSTALKGQYSVQEGLGRLLGSAPVEYRFTGARQVTLNRVSVEQDGALTVGTTTIHANTNGKPSDWVYETPRSVAVITREQIDKRPPRHAADMLEETAGVYTAVNQRDPGLSVNIRGVQDYGRVNMNIDGMRQNFNVNGHQQRNGTMVIDPEFVSSIEIDKGSQSGMGGAAVLGRIASFKTLDASEFLADGKEYGGRLRAGNGIGKLGNGTHFNGSGVFAFGDERGDVLLGYSERHFGDYRAGTHNDQKLGTNLRARKYQPEAFDDWLNSEVGDMGSVTRSQIVKLGLNLPNDQRVQLSYLQSDSDSNDAWAYTADDAQSVYYQRVSKNNLNAKNVALDYSYTPDNPLIDFKAKAYYVTTQLSGPMRRTWRRRARATRSAATPITSRPTPGACRPTTPHASISIRWGESAGTTAWRCTRTNSNRAATRSRRSTSRGCCRTSKAPPLAASAPSPACSITCNTNTTTG